MCYNNIIGNDIMENTEFLIELRRVVKQFKREENYDSDIRRWATTKSLLAGLSIFMKNNPNITDEEIERFIRLNPTSLKVLNDTIDTLPNAIQKLRTTFYLKVLDEFYAARKQYVRNERKARKTMLEK